MASGSVPADRFRWAIIAVAAVLGSLHVLGALQVRDQTYRGYRIRGDGTVVEVVQGSPADLAGIRAGDRLTRIDGAAAADRRALEALPRARVGQTQSVVVERNGHSVELRLTLAGLPPLGVVAYLASGLTGLSFLAFGAWAYLSAPCLATRLLALAGLGVAAAFTEMPYLASPLARAVQESGLIVAAVFGFATLFHFMLVFPEERAFLGRRATVPLIYVPAAVVSAGHVAATVLQRGDPDGMASLTTTASLGLVLVYFCLTVVAVVQGYASTTPARRSAWGLNVLAACILIGLAPMIPTAVGLVAPGVVFPGGDYYDLTWVLIPFALARSTMLQARSSPTLTARARRG